MASILRSSKFVRYFAGLARSIIFNSARGDIDGTLLQKSQCLSTGLTKYVMYFYVMCIEVRLS
jgi:leucine-rich PPR motif-containing protein